MDNQELSITRKTETRGHKKQLGTERLCRKKEIEKNHFTVRENTGKARTGCYERSIQGRQLWKLTHDIYEQKKNENQ